METGPRVTSGQFSKRARSGHVRSGHVTSLVGSGQVRSQVRSSQESGFEPGVKSDQVWSEVS